jgi:PAS domain S-box-containing protein
MRAILYDRMLQTKGAAVKNELRRVIDALPGLVWTARPDGHVDFLNQRWYEYTGLSVDDTCGRGWQTVIHPEDLPDVLQRWRAMLASCEPLETEARLRRSDGLYRRFILRTTPIRDSAGRVVKWCGVNTDVEDRARSDTALKNGEARHAAILNSALDCVITIDHKGCITEFNRAAERTFGYRRDEVIGKEMADVVIPPALRDQHRRGMARYLATGEERVLGRRLEMTAVRADGSTFPVELAITRIPMEGPPSFTGYLRDITESRRAAEKLRESELHLRLMSETIPEMLWSATPQGAVDYCNTRVLDYSGLAAEDVMGNGWTTLLHPDDVAQTTRVWMSCVASGAPYRVEVRTLHAADHTYRWCITSAIPLLDERGRIVKWFGTIVDMHDWKQAQEELRHTQAALAHLTRVMTMGEFTASIAHEVNQPLAGIITNASACLRMLASHPPNLDGARDTAQRTIRDGNRASDIITRLRALFSKNNTVAEAMDLNDATREVVALSLSELQSHSVILTVDLASDLPQVAGDRVQLQQVILNLVRNASDAMSTVADRPRRLLIRTETEPGNRIRLAVQDVGIGFDPHNANRLFEPLYTSKTDGMGMGLSICRSIVESHQGRLWAALNEGPGATFSFSIPCVADTTEINRRDDAGTPAGADAP